MIIKTGEDVVRAMLSCDSSREFTWELTQMKINEPVRVGHTILYTWMDIDCLISKAGLRWKDVQQKVRLGGLEVLSSPSADIIGRFKKVSTDPTLYQEVGIENSFMPKQYMFDVHNSDPITISCCDWEGSMKVATGVFMVVFKADHPTTDVVFATCGGVSHLYNLREGGPIMEFEMYMTQVERSNLLDVLHSSGCRFVPSGKEYINWLNL